MNINSHSTKRDCKDIDAPLTSHDNISASTKTIIKIQIFLLDSKVASLSLFHKLGKWISFKVSLIIR